MKTILLPKLRILLLFCMLIGGASAVHAQPSYKAIRKLLFTDMERAKAALDTFQQKAIASQNDSLIAKSLYLNGVMNYLEGRYYIAADYYKRTLTHSDYLALNTYLHEGIWNNLGVCYELTDNLDEAFVAYDKSLEMAIERKDSQGIAMSWINMGLLATNQNNLDIGERFLRLAEGYFERFPDELYNRGLVYNNLALLLEKQQKTDTEMLQYGRKAIAAFEELGDTINLLLATGNHAMAHITHTQQYATARQLLDRCRSLQTQAEVPPALFAFLTRVEGEYQMAKANYGMSIDYFQQAREIYQDQLNVFELRRVYGLLLQAQAALGDYKAYAALKAEADEAILQVEQARTKARYEELEILHDVKRKESTIQHLDSRVRWLDQTLEKALKASKIKTVLIAGLLLVLALLAAGLYIIQQNNQVHGLQRILFRQSRRLSTASPRLSPSETAHEDPASTELFQRVEAYMEAETPYLNPAFDLKELCAQLNTNLAYASKAINTHSGSNFNQYINAYRVTTAKNLLEARHAAPEKDTINTIGFKSGFNSYDTFRRAFKAETGLTPSQYLKLLEKAPFGE